MTSTKHTINPSARKLNIALYVKLEMVSSTFKFIAGHILVVLYIKWLSLNLELNKNLLLTRYVAVCHSEVFSTRTQLILITEQRNLTNKTTEQQNHYVAGGN